MTHFIELPMLLQIDFLDSLDATPFGASRRITAAWRGLVPVSYHTIARAPNTFTPRHRGAPLKDGSLVPLLPEPILSKGRVRGRERALNAARREARPTDHRPQGSYHAVGRSSC
jgi:hypothetical protein